MNETTMLTAVDAALLITAVSALIAAIGSLAGVGLAIWSAILMRQVKHTTNGMSKRLEDAAEAKGILQGRKDEKASKK